MLSTQITIYRITIYLLYATATKVDMAGAWVVRARKMAEPESSATCWVMGNANENSLGVVPDVAARKFVLPMNQVPKREFCVRRKRFY
jgi:hypothetical protein